MKFCSVSCRSLLAPTAGMMSAAVVGRRVLFAIDDDAARIGEGRARLRGAGLWIVLAAEEFVRTCGGNVFEECCERLEAPVLRIATQERELRAVIGVGVDLAMIELDRADGLRGRIDRRRFGAQAAEGRVLFVRADPGRDRGRGDRAAGFRFEAPGGLIERVAEVVERERLQHQADGIGLVAQRGRARREGALAGGAAPELDDLEFLLAHAFAADGVAAAVRTLARGLVRVRSRWPAEGESGTYKEVSAEPTTGDGFWKMKPRILDGLQE